MWLDWRRGVTRTEGESRMKAMLSAAVPRLESLKNWGGHQGLAATLRFSIFADVGMWPSRRFNSTHDTPLLKVSLPVQRRGFQVCSGSLNPQRWFCWWCLWSWRSLFQSTPLLQEEDWRINLPFPDINYFCSRSILLCWTINLVDAPGIQAGNFKIPELGVCFSPSLLLGRPLC